ncbi:hypothetical protein QO005_002228 [Rhizobium paknamense]|uniref:Peptidoglycan binding-like domain-containing protein n=2 Tax=Rhizobium paknamense TaxID=1206817 RepID=A0ABU0IE13_9HYPH|nr:hypothetical protein [Rhizobium paknamense]
MAQTVETPAPAAANAAPQSPAPAAPVAAAPQPDKAWEQEYALWQAASGGNSAADYKAYLTAYPSGKFAEIAKNRIVSIEAAATPVAPPPPAVPVVVEAPPAPAFTLGTPAIEEALLDRGARREVQGRLTVLGFKTGGTDGVFGNNTRLAISRWQTVVGAPDSGYLSFDQLQRLRADSQGLYEDWLNKQTAVRRAPPRNPDRVLEGRVPKSDDGSAAAALALGVIGGALLGGALAGGGHHHGGPRGPGFRPGPGFGGPCGPRPCR